MVIAQGMSLAFAGVVIGTLSALALSKLIETLLFGVTARDPLVFVVGARCPHRRRADGRLAAGAARDANRSDRRPPLRIAEQAIESLRPRL